MMTDENKNLNDLRDELEIAMIKVRSLKQEIIALEKKDGTYDHWLKEVVERCLNLIHVPEEHRTYELCLEAMKNGSDILDVPEGFRSYEMYFESVKSIIFWRLTPSKGYPKHVKKEIFRRLTKK